MPRHAPDEFGCAGFRAPLRGRREVIRIGGLAGVGLSLPGLLRARAASPGGRPVDPGFGRARSVIMIYLHGGPAQQETWDPKPFGPSPARGEFGAIATACRGSPSANCCRGRPGSWGRSRSSAR
jgi:hypothetical protein